MKGRQTNKALIAVAVLLLTGLWTWQQQAPKPASSAESAAAAAFGRRASGEWMYLQGTVERILEDDNNGARHQRFVLKMDDGHTVLVAHNVDVAPRLAGLRLGETVSVHGEYEWNERGGVVHWTHHDPQGQRQGGYIERMGRRYE